MILNSLCSFADEYEKASAEYTSIINYYWLWNAYLFESLRAGRQSSGKGVRALYSKLYRYKFFVCNYGRRALCISIGLLIEIHIEN